MRAVGGRGVERVGTGFLALFKYVAGGNGPEAGPGVGVFFVTLQIE